MSPTTLKSKSRPRSGAAPPVRLVRDLADNLPFKKAAILQVLLLKGRLYGLEIIDCAGEVGVELKSGTLYPALRSLEADGLVTPEREKGDRSRGGKPRYYYSLTALGRQVINLKRQQMLEIFQPSVESNEGDELAPVPA